MERTLTLMRMMMMMMMMMMIRGSKVAILRWANGVAYTLVLAS